MGHLVHPCVPYSRVYERRIYESDSDLLTVQLRPSIRDPVRPQHTSYNGPHRYTSKYDTNRPNQTQSSYKKFPWEHRTEQNPPNNYYPEPHTK